jgi:hypothetical protein
MDMLRRLPMDGRKGWPLWKRRMPRTMEAMSVAEVTRSVGMRGFVMDSFVY